MWEPAARPVKVWGEAKGLNPPPSIWSCSAPVPPENVAVMVPVGTPLHGRSVLASDSETAAGLTRATDWLLVHRLPSRSTTVWVPELRPV